MPVHNYCSASLLPRLILFSIPFLTFLTWCSYIKKIFVKTYNPSALGSFCYRGDWRWHMLTVTLMPKKGRRRRRMGLEAGKKAYYIYLSLHPLLCGAPGSRKALIYIEPIQCFCFSRGHYVNVFLNQIQYSICYTSFLSSSSFLFLFCAWCQSLHPITDKDIDKWLNTCSYWVIIGLWKH